MPIITWDEKYSVEVKVFNDHHKKLLDLINQLHDAMKVGKSKEVMANILDELHKYTQFHFTEEEKMMQQYNYPGYLKQKEQHTQFVQKVEEFQKNFAAGKVLLTMEIMSFLKDWLVKHIQGSDKQYAEFFHEKGVQ